MKKALFQFLLVVIPYMALYLVLDRINLYERLELREAIQLQKKNLSEKLWNWQGLSEREITDPEIHNTVSKISAKLLGTSNPAVYIHVVDQKDINAYTLPGDHIVLNTGLILNSRSPEELSAVLAHELGHVLGNHVSKNIAKEILIYCLQRLTGEEISNLIFKSALEKGSSLAYQRKLEEEADQIASRLLAGNSIDPLYLGTFLNRNGGKNTVSWLSTHPNPAYRIKLIKSVRDSVEYTTGKILTDTEWTSFRNAVGIAVEQSRY